MSSKNRTAGGRHRAYAGGTEIEIQLETDKENLSVINHLVAKKSLNTRVGDTQFLSPDFCLVQEVPHLDMIEGLGEDKILATNLLSVVGFGKLDQAAVSLVSQDLHS